MELATISTIENQSLTAESYGLINNQVAAHKEIDFLISTLINIGWKEQNFWVVCINKSCTSSIVVEAHSTHELTV